MLVPAPAQTGGLWLLILTWGGGSTGANGLPCCNILQYLVYKLTLIVELINQHQVASHLIIDRKNHTPTILGDAEAGAPVPNPAG